MGPSKYHYMESIWHHMASYGPMEQWKGSILRAQRLPGLGLLKLDVEGCDHALMSDYVTYMRQHPSCALLKKKHTRLKGGWLLVIHGDTGT